VSPRLLVLDDDHNILAVLRTYFGGSAGTSRPARGLGRSGDRRLGCPLRRGDLRPPLHRAHLGEGYEILSRARSRRPRSAVLLFTGAAGEGVREEALRRGADEVIAKPAPLARLRDAALRAMKKP